MTVEELLKQAMKEVVAEQLATADAEPVTEAEEDIEVQEASATQLTSSAKSGC